MGPVQRVPEVASDQPVSDLAPGVEGLGLGRGMELGLPMAQFAPGRPVSCQITFLCLAVKAIHPS